MPQTITQREQEWDAFLDRWPLAGLATMRIEDYTSDNRDSFAYWLEFGETKHLGSMRGGGSYKFGIYHRRGDQSEGAHYAHDDTYSWHRRFGETRDEAYGTIRSRITQCAEAASRGDLEAIEAVDLGDVYKWKIAFLYQNRQTPVILPVYKLAHLRAAIGPQAARATYSALYPQLLANRGEQSIFQLADTVWERSEQILAAVLTQEQAFEYFENQRARFQRIKEPVQYIAGYSTPSGRQIALVRKGSKVKVFVSPGEWLSDIDAGTYTVANYPADKTRNANLAANAPLLAQPHAALRVEVPTMAALEALCDAYDDAEFTAEDPRQESGHTAIPVNQILYGPPGTGKTYKTIDAALRILDGAFWQEHQTNRAELKARFDAHRNAGRIEFVTFHQSFSYEDFVEGLRADTDADGNLRYAVVPGVLKRLCDRASEEGPDSASPRVLIIDEINRGNVSRIFGELITLIEPSKRLGADEALEVVLPYSKRSFGLPGNVYLIGTMNTADRSLSAIDVALRRRFTFEEVPPEPDVLADIEVAGIPLDILLETLNERITALLDRDHCLGHAYFLPLAKPGIDKLAGLADIFRRQILPLLQEYFFEDWQRIAWVLNDHRKEEKYRFVMESGESLQSLFGVDVGRIKTRWRLNDGAFNQAASYQGIIQGSR